MRKGMKNEHFACHLKLSADKAPVYKIIFHYGQLLCQWPVFLLLKLRIGLEDFRSKAAGIFQNTFHP